MHASLDMAACQPLHLLASLNQEAAIGELHRNAPAIPQPNIQAWESRLAVNGQEVEVVVVASIASPELAMLCQVSACNTVSRRYGASYSVLMLLNPTKLNMQGTSHAMLY